MMRRIAANCPVTLVSKMDDDDDRKAPDYKICCCCHERSEHSNAKDSCADDGHDPLKVVL